MDSSLAEFDVNVCWPGDLDAGPGSEGTGFVVDWGSLYDFLTRLEDRRDPRGVRYPLAWVLTMALLAKLAGEDRLTGIAEWVQHRKEALARALGLPRPQAPHRTTYSRILGSTLSVEDFEGMAGAFFAQSRQPGATVQLTIDGKTLRGSIGAGETRGEHLLAAYLPGEGVVLAQVAVDRKENEITAAPRLLETIDLRDKVVSGDAMLTQRELSRQVVERGGDYLWSVKDNQPQLRDDLATCFADASPSEPGLATTGPATTGPATTVEKGHGRVEQRRLWASADLNDYLDWPYVQQVFRLDRHTQCVKTGVVTNETVYGVTSLSSERAGPQQLLSLARGHWNIENGLHYRRDETLREDWCHLRLGHTQRMMAAINNLVLGLLLRRGVKNVPQQRRRYAARWDEALKLITSV